MLSKLSLACLLTALLALPHCENDDNGGGGGASSLNAIYLWVTGCEVRGHMRSDRVVVDGGSDLPALSNPCTLPADAPMNGPERADAICANQYETGVTADGMDVVDEVHHDRIAGEGNPRHIALLARSIDPPREAPREFFPVRGRALWKSSARMGQRSLRTVGTSSLIQTLRSPRV